MLDVILQKSGFGAATFSFVVVRLDRNSGDVGV